MSGVGNSWTRVRYDGAFGLVALPPDATALSLVFVQSADGNTVAANPALLGGGATDQVLIYEGLSRVAADAVLAGAGSVHAGAFLSVWHPELVSLRAALGLPRHPAQIVVTDRAELPSKVLRRDVSGAGEGEHCAPLPSRDLSDDMACRAKSVDAQPLGIASHHQ